jgi:hypothetical protein
MDGNASPSSDPYLIPLIARRGLYLAHDGHGNERRFARISSTPGDASLFLTANWS